MSFNPMGVAAKALAGGGKALGAAGMKALGSAIPLGEAGEGYGGAAPSAIDKTPLADPAQVRPASRMGSYDGEALHDRGRVTDDMSSQLPDVGPIRAKPPGVIERAAGAMGGMMAGGQDLSRRMAQAGQQPSPSLAAQASQQATAAMAAAGQGRPVAPTAIRGPPMNPEVVRELMRRFGRRG